jgi:hypothetical protein
VDPAPIAKIKSRLIILHIEYFPSIINNMTGRQKEDEASGVDPRGIGDDPTGESVARLLDTAGIGSVNAAVNRFMNERIADIETANNLRAALDESTTR